jgi:hypothetical protein
MPCTTQWRWLCCSSLSKEHPTSVSAGPTRRSIFLTPAQSRKRAYSAHLLPTGGVRPKKRPLRMRNNYLLQSKNPAGCRARRQFANRRRLPARKPPLRCVLHFTPFSRPNPLISCFFTVFTPILFPSLVPRLFGKTHPVYKKTHPSLTSDWPLLLPPRHVSKIGPCRNQFE